MIGKTLSHYRIVEGIGAGGMGEVYRARDERLERDVALKVLPTGTLADEATRKRFRKEALALSKLNHPNIATVHDFDTQDGVDFLVMELVEGVTLNDKLAAGALPEKEITRLGAQLAEGLAAAHERRVVHRDLKPANLRVTPDGRLKILDFGLAKLVRPDVASATAPTESFTETQAVAGTLPYMAPEQLRGEAVDTRTDIYAAAAVLYEMATGQRPFPETQGPRLIAAILQQAPKPPSELNRRVSLALENIILKGLDKEPENRYQHANELAVDLRRLGTASTALRPAAAAPKRLAVLPLENLTGDPEQEYFVDGMHEEVIATLAKISALAVTSRTSVRQYKELRKPLPEIARELGVDTIVEGTVRRSGNQVRITVQLIEAATDKHLWAESYQRELRDVFALQGEVAQAIANEIRVTLTPKEQAQLASARRVNPEAYEAYLKGRFHWYKLSREDLDTAMGYFELALEKDPNSALAYVGIAYVWLSRGETGVPPHEAIPKAKAAALKALELDDTLAEVHEVLANVKLAYEWDWAGGEREFQRAIELNPNSADARFFYGDFLISMRRSKEGLVEIERALELDPFNLLLQCFFGWNLVYLRRYDEAIAQLRKTLSREPNSAAAHLGLWGAFWQKQMYEEALAEAQSYHTLLGYSEVAEVLSQSSVRSNYQGAMRLAAAALVARSKQTYVPRNRIARLYAHAGEEDRGLEWLEKAYEERELPLCRLRVVWDWDSLRDDPRFQSLLRRMNFPE